MKIRDRIKQLKKAVRTTRYIAIAATHAEYDQRNTGFFLEDADEYTEDLDNSVLDFEVTNERNYMSNGVQCTALFFTPGRMIQ